MKQPAGEIRSVEKRPPTPWNREQPAPHQPDLINFVDEDEANVEPKEIAQYHQDPNDLEPQPQVKIPSFFTASMSGGKLVSMKSSTKFCDVIGVDEAKEEVQKIVRYVKERKHFIKFGAELPKGVLLCGPPGNGKTMMAEAIAGEGGVHFIQSSGSELGMSGGVQKVKAVFSKAEELSSCIIFVDEIDKIHDRMTIDQLFVELDGIKQKNLGIIVIAATDQVSLNRALVRHGRFDRRVFVPYPDVEGRRQILESRMSKVPKANNLDLRIIAQGTPGFSGADLRRLVNDAALKAADDGAKVVSMDHLEFAREKIIMGNERKTAYISEESKKIIAYHESGHALVAIHTAEALPVHKVTIVPRGDFLGMVSHLPAMDGCSISKTKLLAQLDVALGGRVAEDLIFGESGITSGASSDFGKATNLAKKMVTRYGMSEAIGVVSYNYDGKISNETRHLIEKEVKKLLDKAYFNATKILCRHMEELKALAEALLARETITRSDINLLFSELKK